jgi:hypothetical protein
MTQYPYEDNLVVYDVQGRVHHRLKAFEQARG